MNKKRHCQACSFRSMGVKTRKNILHTCGLDEHRIMMFEQFNEQDENHLFYNHWGKVFSLSDFISHFVTTESMFSKNEIDACVDKYNIDEEAEVAWVSSDTKPNDRKGMSVDSYNRSNDVPETDITDVFVDGEDGFVVPEISDGQNSFLFVIKKK